MGKDAALSMLTGTPSVANPSIMTGQPTGDAPVATPEPVTATAPAPLDSDRFAHLVAKEKELRKVVTEFKSEQQKMYEEKEKIRVVKDQYERFVELKKTNPVEAIKYLGIQEEELLNFLADKQPEEQTPEQKATLAAQTEIQKLRDEMKAKEDKIFKEKEDRAINGYKTEITNSIKKEAEKYKFLNHYGPIAEDLVYTTILSYIEADGGEVGNPLDVMKEAMNDLEQHYLDDYNAKVAFMTPKQIEAAVLEEAKAPQRTRTVQPPVQPVDKAVQKPAPTLSSRATATVAGSAPKAETKAQKRERLEAVLRGGWNK